jgi:hypothetical protein
MSAFNVSVLSLTGVRSAVLATRGRGKALAVHRLAGEGQLKGDLAMRPSTCFSCRSAWLPLEIGKRAR